MPCRQLLGILIIFALVGLSAGADKAKTAYDRGVQAERKAKNDEACALYKEAHTLAPNNARYYSAYALMRSKSSTQHLYAGQALRKEDKLEEALAEFQRAFEIDSSSFVADQEVRRTMDMIRRRDRQAAASIEPVKPGEEIADPVVLQPLSTGALTLRLSADADVAYKTIGKLAGLNVLIDPDYRPEKITVDLTDVTIRDALDLVRLQSKTFWRPVLPNTIFVTSDSPAKRKEHEQNVIRTFYLQNISAPSDLQEAGNMVRQMLDVSRVQLLQAQDALIVRGTPDQLVLAEKLLADYDKPKSEVVINVAVMQVSRDLLRTLGTNLPTSTSVGLVLPQSEGDSATATSGGLTLKALRNVGADNFVISVPSASFSALAGESSTRILQRPEIRTLNNVKATLRIGDRVPIATGSFQPGLIGGGSISPLISTQFQYIDVGVNMDLTPHIHSESQVTLKMVLEISAVTGSQSIGGITQPIIGQRRIEHETRLADGEVNMLGGILEESETQSMSGWPGLIKIPILKYLFAQETKDVREKEIVFAIIPHIVRGPEYTEEDMRVVDVGTGSGIELRRKPSATATAAERPAGTARSQQSGPLAAPAKSPASPASPASPQAQPGAKR